MMLPWMYGEIRDRERQRREAADRQVRAKFPDLIAGSAGWDRAVRNRVRRLRFTRTQGGGDGR